MTPDPVRDAMRAVFANGFQAGWRSGSSQQQLGRCLRCFAAGVLLTLIGIGVAVAGVAPSANANSYRRDLTRISRTVWGLDSPVALLAAQIEQESAWNPGAISRSGAAGLAQFMPATARDMALALGGAPAPFDARWSMLAQSRYMADLLTRADGLNACESWAFALAAYNGGEGHVRARKHLSRYPRRCLGATCDIRPRGVSQENQRENRRYSRKILLTIAPVFHQAAWGGPDPCGHYGGS